jgi:hypothetical protein
MDRPKHRRFIFLCIALLAGGTLLLLGRHWTSEPDPLALPAKALTQQLPAPAIDSVDPTTPIETAERSASTTQATRAKHAAGFRGRIIDAVTRQPVTEFAVKLVRVDRARGYTEEEPLTRDFKSKTGRFTWGDAPAGSWRAAVSARGYQQFNLDDLEILADKATREFVMPLLRGHALRGRVFENSTGTGIAGAQISFRPSDADEDYFGRRPRATSKDDGSFTLDGVPSGNVIVTFNAPSHAPRNVEVAVDEKTPPLEIAVITGGTIAGTVTTAAGAPMKGSIHLEGPSINFGTETQATGDFSFKYLRPGTYRVSAATSKGSASQVIALGQDEIKTGIMLVMEAGRSIRGMVRGLQATALDDVQIMLRPESKPGSFSAQPDEHGAYALNGVPAGRAVIGVFGPHLQFDRTVDVPADQDLTLDLVFPTGARLSGRVTKGGKPVAGRSVWMRPAEDKSDTLYQALTQADGSYEIEGLPPGDYRLRADEDISRLVSIAGDAVLNIDIPSVQLAVRVVEDGGAVPIVGAKAYVRGSEPATARVRGDRQTDDFGEFRLTGIEPGDIMLMVYKPGYELHREKIAYSAPITNKTITLRKSAGVDVRVKPGSRRFPRGFTLTQYIPNNDYQIDLWMPLDREGMCHVPAALAGTTFHIGRFSGEPIVFEEWDGQPFELP